MGRKKVETEQSAKAVLQRVLLRLRWDDQGGYVGYEGDGKWNFISTSLPQVTTKELNTLMWLAGIVPDVIEPLGDCSDCQHWTKMARAASRVITAPALLANARACPTSFRSN